MGQLGGTSRFLVNTTGMSRLSHASTTQKVEKSGEMTLDNNIDPGKGVTKLIVPPGVTKISVVSISSGFVAQDLCYYCYTTEKTVYVKTPGAPGVLAYSNFIPVIPGEVLCVTVEKASSTAASLVYAKIERSGQILIRATTSRVGNSGAYNSDAQVIRSSGWYCATNTAPGYMGPANNPTYPPPTGSGAGYVESINALYTRLGTALYGLGPEGTSSKPGGSIPSCAPDAKLYGVGSNQYSATGPGGIRVIWGGSRGFPTNARKITP